MKIGDIRLGVPLLLLCAASACEKPAPPPPPPPEVYVADAIQRDVPVYLDLVGQTEGFQDVEIRARVEGFLETVTFKEGAFVKKGDILYQIDRKPFETVIAGAKADIAAAEARLAKARNDVTRYKPLVTKQAVSQQELDNALAAQDAATAEVEAGKATLEQAQINLGYTTVTAPIDGLVGTTQVKPGNLVGRGEPTLLTTISQIDPVIFRVGITEADYLRVARRRGTAGRGTPPADLELTLADGTVLPQKGRLGPIERAVDPTTGTLAIQFIFANPNGLVRPGQYGRARIVLETKVGAVLVQQRAVQELQNLYSVGILVGDKVEFRNVKVGQKVGSMWVIEEGVKPGEKVVVEGLQRVQSGMTVTSKPAPAMPGEAR
jgi:membrane fusion protein, multidrug efflux system